ncbi:hypothetical protein CspeluHIS016_0502070 [Cutaneotrichosporon spelunceum]|uniref:Cyanovirin-N domain-containing protein n=1 Tax=Cutaneotrichosporon spelunceum TaxID=1672016 RepID=A0AAD3YCJ6_9TREE|nr:hypothetical protein CspeluHIS016_0502070 [Cutaneotrichosporon spelunceum]
MHFTTLLSSLLLATAAFGAVTPQPQARSNADAIRRGLPLLKPRVCDAQCQADRLARRAKPSKTSLPDRSVQFRKTCKDWKLTLTPDGKDIIMSGDCWDSEDVLHPSTLSLNTCIGVNKGTLVCNPGDFMSTGGCQDCTYTDETLNCLCPDSKGDLSKASLNLNACIGNLEALLQQAPDLSRSLDPHWVLAQPFAATPG